MIMSCVACGNNSKNSDDNEEGGGSDVPVTEDVNAAQKEGYNNGYKDGYKDGYEEDGYYMRTYNYDRDNHYKTYNAGKAYIEAYRKGYPKGYEEGQEVAEEEAQKEARNRNYHNWESEDIEGFYVELEECENDDQADYYSRTYYEGEYICEWGRYFAKTSVNSGVGQVELGEKVSSKLFALKGTNLFIHFKWTTSLSKWDEGVIDVFASRGTFYLKPE